METKIQANHLKEPNILYQKLMSSDLAFCLGSLIEKTKSEPKI